MTKTFVLCVSVAALFVAPAKADIFGLDRTAGLGASHLAAQQSYNTYNRSRSSSNYTNLNILVDQVLSADSGTWTTKYLRGTVSGAYVKSRSSDGRRATIRARYTYGGSRTKDWVEIRMYNGRARCVEYGATPWDGCRKIGGMTGVQVAAVGAAIAVVAGVASSASGSSNSRRTNPNAEAEFDTNGLESRRNCNGDYYIDNNGYARPAC